MKDRRKVAELYETDHTVPSITNTIGPVCEEETGCNVTVLNKGDVKLARLTSRASLQVVSLKLKKLCNFASLNCRKLLLDVLLARGRYTG
jgi:hypothetical protein